MDRFLTRTNYEVICEIIILIRISYFIVYLWGGYYKILYIYRIGLPGLELWTSEGGGRRTFRWDLDSGAR